MINTFLNNPCNVNAFYLAFSREFPCYVDIGKATYEFCSAKTNKHHHPISLLSILHTVSIYIYLNDFIDTFYVRASFD